MKKKRHQLILELIDQYEITTQEELLALLQKNNFDVTQATVSRDIKELRLAKTPGKNGLSKYAHSVDSKKDRSMEKFYAIFSHSVISVDAAINLVIIKCYAGTASAAAAAIDAMGLDGIVGSLAGDDTIFVACRTEEAAVVLTEKITKMLSGEEV